MIGLNLSELWKNTKIMFWSLKLDKSISWLFFRFFSINSFQIWSKWLRLLVSWAIYFYLWMIELVISIYFLDEITREVYFLWSWKFDFSLMCHFIVFPRRLLYNSQVFLWVLFEMIRFIFHLIEGFCKFIQYENIYTVVG